MPDRDAELLERAECYLREQVAPRAEAIDQDPAALQEAMDGLAGAGLLALRRPEAFGGPAVSEPTFRRFQELSARHSGTLSFLMTQHQSAVSLIAKGDSDALRHRWLPRMHDELRVGIGISQLRRKGEPMTMATETAGGYRVRGRIPWVTGLGFFGAFVVGARLPDGKALFALVPFGPQAELPLLSPPPMRLEFSPPMRLCAMESALTVSAEIDAEIHADDVVMIKPPDWPETNDMLNVVLQGHFALGCAQAGVDLVWAAASAKPVARIADAAASLQREVEACREAMANVPGGMDDRTTAENLRLRAWAIELAVRCAHAAVVAHSGAANAMTHPAQRVYREALVFSVSAQTGPIMEATLDRLVRPVD